MFHLDTFKIKILMKVRTTYIASKIYRLLHLICEMCWIRPTNLPYELSPMLAPLLVPLNVPFPRAACLESGQLSQYAMRCVGVKLLWTLLSELCVLFRPPPPLRAKLKSFGVGLRIDHNIHQMAHYYQPEFVEV